MDLLHPQLRAFTAVLEEGSFEAAGRRLHITSSAISQRIKALEDRLGQVLVLRQPPCRPTPAGELLLRRVRPMQALEAEALADFLPEKNGTNRPIAIAVNSDSLDTWFLQALAQLSQAHGYLFDVRVDDQDHTLELIRNGSVLGAVTAEPTPLQGCEVQALGIMRYQAIASAAFVSRHFSQGAQADSLAQAPMIVFNRKDELQWRFIRQITDVTLAPHPLSAHLDRLCEGSSLGAGLVPGPGLHGLRRSGSPGTGLGRPGPLAGCPPVLAACRDPI